MSRQFPATIFEAITREAGRRPGFKPSEVREFIVGEHFTLDCECPNQAFSASLELLPGAKAQLTVLIAPKLNLLSTLKNPAQKTSDVQKWELHWSNEGQVWSDSLQTYTNDELAKEICNRAER